MGTSAREGKVFARSTLRKIIETGDIKVEKVFDIGAGRGNWFSWLENIKWHGMRPTKWDGPALGAEWHAIEIFEKYIEKFKLHDHYKTVRCEDARELTDKDFEGIDLVIFGDVLEHMTEEEARKLYQLACKYAKIVLISIPIRVFIQGTMEGNKHERHLVHWTHEEIMEKFDPTPQISDTGKTIGIYFWIKQT